MSDADPLDTSSLLTTKLYQPPVTPNLIPRQKLLDRLQRNRQRPFTLISAPAGYGKSVLASMWLEASGLPGGWVSLDETDNDFGIFARYFLAAIEKAIPHAVLETQTLLNNTISIPPSAALARYLRADLEKIETPFLLVLDDIHHIHDENIFDFLEALLNFRPPNFQLILIGRQDPPLPIGSYRAYQQITEIRMRDLRFHQDETSRFLQQMLKHPIREDIAAEWTKYTEGWPVALHLAALALRNRRQPVRWDVNIPRDIEFLQEYLLNEVLAELPPSLQDCLLKTALLDRFCSPLCEAVCLEDGNSGRADMTGKEFIQWLQKSNLFLINLDQHNEWFRFHHLFQSDLQYLLKSRLDQKEISAIHRRAGQWLAEHGWIEEAIRNMLAAGDTRKAIDLLNQHRYRLMNQDDWNRLERWLRYFPSNVVDQDLTLLITKGTIGIAYGRLSEIPLLVRKVESQIDALPHDSPADPSLLSELALMKSAYAALNEDVNGLLANSEEALAYLPPEAGFLRGLAVLEQLVGHHMAGTLDKGIAITRESLKVSRELPAFQIQVVFSLCAAYLMEGDLDKVKLYAAEVERLGRKHHFSYSISHGHYFLGITAYLRHDFAEAEQYLLAIVNNPITVQPTYLAYGGCALAQIYYSKKELKAGDQLLQKLKTFMEETGRADTHEVLRAYELELALTRGDLPSAEIMNLTIDFEARPILWFHFMTQLTPIKLLLHQGDWRSLEEAVTLLIRLEARLRKMNRKAMLIDVLACQAWAYYAQGNIQLALDRLDESMMLAEPGGLIQNYIVLGPKIAELATLLNQREEPKRLVSRAFIARVLAASETNYIEEGILPRLPFEDGTPRLTKRELETLQYLATELSPEDIAIKMVISPATVRTHIRNIYGKMKVGGRFEAVHRAKEIGLINSF